MSYPAFRVQSIVILSLVIGACSQKDAGNTVDTPPETAHEAAVKEIETQPVTELDQVHVSEKLLETYQRSCGTCHERGVVNAPKTGDTTAWAPRLSQGMDTLLSHVRNGFKAMPPAGLCYDCSDKEYEALILYMAAPKAASQDSQ